MTVSFPSCTVVSLPDVELEGQITCAWRCLVAIAPGFTEPIAKAMVQKWRELAVMCESLNNPEFMRVPNNETPFLDALHKDFDAAKVVGHEHLAMRGIVRRTE
jgi:hypothetical protein